MLIVTTTFKASRDIEQEAIRTAGELGARYVPRGRTTLTKLKKNHPGAPVVVIGTDTFHWHPAGQNGGEPFFFHPGMSLIRAKRLAGGQNDPLLAASGFAPGDTVVDATAGLAADAIVFSFAGGPSSQIVAVESELPLHYVVSRGLRTYESGWPTFDEALRRIEPVRSGHTDYLKTLADRSVDIVYFDPMFREPIHDAAGLSPLRPLANAAPLGDEAVAEARRVARKAVVLKERGRADVWGQYGFTVVSKPDAAVAYGVIQL